MAPDVGDGSSAMVLSALEDAEGEGVDGGGGGEGGRAAAAMSLIPKAVFRLGRKKVGQRSFANYRKMPYNIQLLSKRHYDGSSLLSSQQAAALEAGAPMRRKARA